MLHLCSVSLNNTILDAGNDSYVGENFVQGVDFDNNSMEAMHNGDVFNNVLSGYADNLHQRCP